MIKLDPNLESMWEIMLDNPDVFNEKDLIVLLESHLNYDVAISLRAIGAIPPCYQSAPCASCAYERFCRNKKQRRQKELSDGEDYHEAYRKQLLENISAILLDGKSWGLE